MQIYTKSCASPSTLNTCLSCDFHRTRHQRNRGADLVGNIGKELHLGAVELLNLLLLEFLLLKRRIEFQAGSVGIETKQRKRDRNRD